jgi:hypothetical protein
LLRIEVVWVFIHRLSILFLLVAQAQNKVIHISTGLFKFCG